MNSPMLLAAEAMPAWLPAAIMAAFLVLFPLLWCAVLWLLSLLGGWHRLSRQYRSGDRPVTGVSHGGVSGMVGWVSYRHVLTVHMAPDGLFIDVMALFRCGHPRLFIPWAVIHAPNPYRALFWNAERFDVGTPVQATITLPAGLARPNAPG